MITRPPSVGNDSARRADQRFQSPAGVVTGGALVGQRPIPCEQRIGTVFLPVTLLAGRDPMGALESVGDITIVVEAGCRQPRLPNMATLTTRTLPRLIKLTLVRILVTGKALRGETTEVCRHFAFGTHMACGATQFEVGPVETETGLLMIEVNLVPGGDPMTTLATGIGRRIRTGPDVRIQMAAHAAGRRKAQLKWLARPPVDCSVARLAKHVLMTTLEDKNRPMFIQAVACWRESVDVVAGLAGPAIRTISKLPGVIILVTVGATLEGDFPPRLAGQVAGLATDLAMATL
jgi:hypothetical protein